MHFKSRDKTTEPQCCVPMYRDIFYLNLYRKNLSVVCRCIRIFFMFIYTVIISFTLNRKLFASNSMKHSLAKMKMECTFCSVMAQNL